jgi:hypothetical protein
MWISGGYQTWQVTSTPNRTGAQRGSINSNKWESLAGDQTTVGISVPARLNGSIRPAESRRRTYSWFLIVSSYKYKNWKGEAQFGNSQCQRNSNSMARGTVSCQNRTEARYRPVRVLLEYWCMYNTVLECQQQYERLNHNSCEHNRTVIPCRPAQVLEYWCMYSTMLKAM